MSTLEFVVRTRGGEKEVKKTAEIAGKGKDYLCSLSANLSRMQSEVNAYLTQLVEKERAEKLGENQEQRGTTSGNEGCSYIRIFNSV